MNLWTRIDYDELSALPDADMTVLVYMPDGEIEMAYYTGDYEGIGPRWLTTDGREIEPLYWIDIPEGPKE
jgi:hypothetical protein